MEYKIGEIPDSVILPDDERAVRPVTAYMDPAGRIWRSEHDCRTYGSPWYMCKRCGMVAIERDLQYCSGCRSLNAIDRWKKLPIVEWDGTTPIVEIDDDEYIFDSDQLCDWIERRRESQGCGDLRALFVLCEPVPWRLVNASDIIEAINCEDTSDIRLPDGVEGLVDKANKLLQASPTPVWHPKSPVVAVDVSKWIGESDQCS